ncbi:hypothetical protein Tco_0265324 [Tanacetum coccineum]
MIENEIEDVDDLIEDTYAEENLVATSGKESAVGVLSKSTSSPFILSAIKQGNMDYEDRIDLGSSKSKQSKAMTNLKLSNAKLNSANAYTWPINQQRNNEDQPTCLSDSRDYGVLIRRDAILCDLEAPKNDVHSLSESALIPSSEEIHASQSDDIEDKMTCKLPEETESAQELQAAEDVLVNPDAEENFVAALDRMSTPTQCDLYYLGSDEYAYSVRFVMLIWDRMSTPTQWERMGMSTQCDMFVWYILVLFRPMGYLISEDPEKEQIEEEPLKEPKEEG